MTPYKRFSLTLGLALLVSTVAVTAVVSVLVQRLLIQDTALHTAAAVQAHVRQLFGFDLFAPAPPEKMPDTVRGTGNPPGEDGYTDGEGYGADARPGADSTGPDGIVHPLHKFDAMVRMHFDLYDVVHTVFYRTNGTIAYSYRPEEIGTTPNDAPEWLDRAKRKPWFEIVDWFTPGGSLPVLRQQLPIVQAGAVVGIIEVHRNLVALIHELRVLQVLVGGVVVLVFMAVFLTLRRIYLASTDTITRQSRDLAAAHDATIHALSTILDTHDSETEGHCLRVAAYTTRLAQQMGMNGTELETLARGALLHDIGKIGVADNILRKPGPLTEAELAEMHKHPGLGDQMLRHIPFLAGVVPVVLYHHEWYNGRGYPHGLQAEEIPLGARIFAVIDAFDAMLSDRPYRRARSFAEAKAEIQSCAGTQFDPRVVRAFLEVSEAKWRAIAEHVARFRDAGGPLSFLYSGAPTSEKVA